MKAGAPEKPLITKAERQVKRQERRLKQRAQNIGRAAKMHKARLAAAGTPQNPQKQAALPAINIGCSGWFYWDWRGRFYPADMPTSGWFDHYKKTFRTVELNAPFYSWPTLANVEVWKKQAGRNKFVYTVKACELITHIKKFENTKTLVKDFGFIADLLGPRMGCFLFQLPPSFTYTPARLQNILAQLDHKRRNVIEFRHKSWWNDDVYKAFTKTGTIFCSCSGPKLPDDLIRTADDIYVRFHGPERWYKHDYTDDELEMWAGKIRASGAKRIWAYFNNDFGGNAIRNAKRLETILKRD